MAKISKFVCLGPIQDEVDVCIHIILAHFVEGVVPVLPIAVCEVDVLVAVGCTSVVSKPDVKT